MLDLDERFRSLGRAHAPDLWTEIEVREPSLSGSEPSSGRRWLAAAVAFAVAAAGLTFAASVFRSGHQPMPTSTVTNGKIAFSGFDGESWQIYSVEPDGSGLTQLTHVPGSDVAEDPAWSPDGARIAYVVQASHEGGTTGRSDIWVMNADGSDPRKLTDGPGSSWSPAWSPDGTRIVFARGDPSNLYVINADGTGFTHVTEGTTYASDPSTSPDGSRIVFGQTGEVEKDLYVVNADGTDETRLLQLPGYQIKPAWSPDGLKIAFTGSSPDGADFGVWVMDADGTNVRSLTDQPAAQSPAWSPDGRQIVFMGVRPGTDHETLYVMNADGSDAHELSGLPTEAAFPSWQPVPVEPTPDVTPSPAPSITPRGNGQIYFRIVGSDDGSGRIGAVDPDGNDQRVAFPAGSPLSQGHIAWSPDGRRIAFDGYFGSHAGISTSDPDGGAIASITDGPNDTWPSWSPDGSKIVFASTRHDPTTDACPTGIDLRCPTDIYVMNSDGSNMRRLTTDPAPEWDPVWSPDGSQIAFVKGDSNTEIVVMNTDGTDARTVTSTEGGSGLAPSWSPDGTKIVFGSIQYEDWGIFVVNADGTDEHSLLFADSIYATDPVWSPDGSLIAFAGRGLYTVRPDGSDVTMIASDATAGFPGSVAWQPVLSEQGSPSPTQPSPPSPVSQPIVGERIDVGQASALAYAAGSVWADLLRDARTSTGTVLRIDPDSGKILARIPVDAYPDSEHGGGGMVFDGRYLWIAATAWPEGQPEHGILVRIDPETNTAETIDLPVWGAEELVFDGGFLWTTGVSSPGKDPRVLQIDPASGEVVSETPIDAEWWGNLVVEGGAIWITEMSVRNSTVLGDATLVRLEPGTGAELACVSVVDRNGVMGSVVPVSSGGAIWAATGSELLRIDPQSGDVLSRSALSVGGDLEPAADGSLWCLCGQRWDTLQRLNPVTEEVDVTVSLDPKPIPVAIAVAPNAVWVRDYEG